MNRYPLWKYLFVAALMLISGQLWTLWLPAVFFYGLAPLIDRWLGEDQSNPPESAVPALDASWPAPTVTRWGGRCCPGRGRRCGGSAPTPT
jgi:hypothetical protein